MEPAVCYPAQAGIDALGGEVGLLGLIDCDEGGFAVVDNVEFVLSELLRGCFLGLKQGHERSRYIAGR